MVVHAWKLHFFGVDHVKIAIPVVDYVEVAILVVDHVESAILVVDHVESARPLAVFQCTYQKIC